MFAKRSNRTELMDDLNLANQGLRKNLDELVRINQHLGAKSALINALEQVYQSCTPAFAQSQLRIADLGCGAGDMLVAIQSWLQTKQLSAELIGIDANQFMIEYAQEKFPHAQIQYQTSDIFSSDFLAQSFDIVTLNTVCHHFDDPSLMKLFKQLIPKTRVAIIINDLHRHWIPYFTIKSLTTLGNFSYLAKHDAPLSVLRAFKKSELMQLLRESSDCFFDIRWRWAFRWQAIIWKYSAYPL